MNTQETLVSKGSLLYTELSVGLTFLIIVLFSYRKLSQHVLLIYRRIGLSLYRLIILTAYRFTYATQGRATPLYAS